MDLSEHSLVESFRRISIAARSWLGSSDAGHTFKCIIDGSNPHASVLVGDLRSYLLAVNDSDPTATGLLLEILETVVSSLLHASDHLLDHSDEND